MRKIIFLLLCCCTATSQLIADTWEFGVECTDYNPQQRDVRDVGVFV